MCLALAARDDNELVALTFDYGQRHRVEIERAGEIAGRYRAEWLVVSLDASQWGGSALTDASLAVPVALSTPVLLAVPAARSFFHTTVSLLAHGQNTKI